jgi:hypothetical protein
VNGIVNNGVITNIPCAEEITFELFATMGYRVKTLLVDNVLTPVPVNNRYIFSNIFDDHSIEATFEEYPQFIIQFGPNASQNEGGIVFRTDRPDDEYSTVVDSAADCHFTITPDAGFVIDKVYVDDINIPGAVASGTYNFVALRTNHTIYATFKPIMYTITATATANGMINPSGIVPAAHGSTPTFLVLPNIGAELISLKVDGADVPLPTNFTYIFPPVYDNHTIHAQFAKFQYTITTIAGDNGSVAPIDPIVEYGDNKTITFYPVQGYKVDKVWIDGNLNPAAALAGYYTFVNVTANHEIEVTFTKQIFNIIASVSGHGNIAYDGNLILDTETIGVAYDEHSPIFVFNPEDGYIVKQVLVDNVINYQALVLGEYRFLNVKENHTLHVTYAPDHFTIVATAAPGGAISPTGVVVVPTGTDKTFVIAPNAGYELIRVLIDDVEQPLAFTYTFSEVEDDHTITAQFEKLYYNVTFDCQTGAYATPVNGSVSPVEYGSIFMFVVDIEAPYSQSHVMVRANGIVINPDKDNIYTLNNITIDQNIVVDGLTNNQYRLTAKTGNLGGEINPAGVTIVNHGDDMTYKITPDKGYKVNYLVINGISYDPAETYTFSNIKADATIVAYFRYTVGIDEPEAIITVYSYEKTVTILNKDLVPVKQVDIMDMYGRLVWTGQATGDETTIPLNVAAGIYTVRIITEANEISATKVAIK